jgi:HD-GYP domain-containing protein (c-di-GMP phosphodiesterase class II)
MAQVILIEDNKTMNDLISVNLTTYLGVDLIQRSNAQETINLLTILPSVDLIITRDFIEGVNSAELIDKYLIDNNLEITLIVLGKPSKKYSDNTITIPDQKDWEQVIQTSAKVLGINENVLASKAVPDYSPVPVRYFLNIDNSNCDVFIRIKKSAAEYQFVKRIHNGDTFSKDSIRRYMDQGLEFFYVSKDHYKNFAIFLSNRLVEKIDSPHLEQTQKIQLMGDSYEIAVKEITKLGFNSETVQLTDTIIENMIKNFEKSPEMSGLLHKVINSKTGIQYQRSHMISVVACEVVKNLKLEDPKAFEKISFAAFFHDIKLHGRDDLININSYEELEQNQLSDEDFDLVFNHAFEASQFVRSHPEAPLGADTIILHQHGTYNGKGYSNAIERLPDLSKIFVISHQFVTELLRFKQNGGEPKPITEELFKRYPIPDVAIIIKALEKTLKKKK